MGRERTGSEALYEVDDVVDDDADLDDSLLATYPTTTSDPEETLPRSPSEVEQNWRTAIN